MMMLVGVKGGLDDSESKFAVGTLRRDAGIKSIRVNERHTQLMFVEFDEHRLGCVDIIKRMYQIGLDGKVCGS